MFEHNFDCGVNFSGENFCWRFFSLEVCFADREKTAKIRTRKNLVPHGILLLTSGDAPNHLKLEKKRKAVLS